MGSGLYGYSTTIDSTTEDHLLNKQSKILDIYSDLPNGMGEALLRAHPGETKYMIMYGDLTYSIVQLVV
jgi:hypothetical protein